MAINVELEHSFEDFRVGVNEMEQLVTSVAAAKRECRLVDLSFSTKKHHTTPSFVIEAMTNAGHAVIGTIADLDALAVVHRDGVGAALCALLWDKTAQNFGVIGDVVRWHTRPLDAGSIAVLPRQHVGEGAPRLAHRIPCRCQAGRFWVLRAGALVASLLNHVRVQRQSRWTHPHPLESLGRCCTKTAGRCSSPMWSRWKSIWPREALPTRRWRRGILLNPRRPSLVARSTLSRWLPKRRS